MKAMILAAGRGERMGALTAHTAKPLLQVGGKALIDYHLIALKQAGITDIVINVSYHGQKIIDYLGDGSAYGVNIQYSFEETPLDIGGGIFKALPLLGEDPFVILSADIWTAYPFAQLNHPITNLGHIVLVDNPPFHPQGDFALEQGSPKLNYAGFGILSPRLFEGCKRGVFGIYSILAKARSEHQISAEHYQGTWFNVGTPEILQEVESYLSKLPTGH